MKVEEAFGAVLKDFRENKDMTQKKLAIESELDRTYISMLERGIKSPTINTVFKIATVLKVKPSQLLQLVEKTLEKDK